MKKNTVIITLALVLALSVSGCGKKKADTAQQNTQQTDVSDAYSQPADISKVPAEAANSDTSKDDYSGKLGDYEVTIGDAKIVDNDGEEAVIVSFIYKNKSGKDMPFSAAIHVDAYQDDSKLAGTVVTDVEGVNMNAIGERVKSGDSIEVQQAYTLRDKSAPLEIEVTEFNRTDEKVLVKTFTF